MENVVFLNFQCVKGSFFLMLRRFFFVFDAHDFHHLFPFLSPLSSSPPLSLLSSLLLFSSPWSSVASFFSLFRVTASPAPALLLLRLPWLLVLLVGLACS